MEASIKAGSEAKYVRAGELSARAADAAVALYGADSIVVAFLQSWSLDYEGCASLQAVDATDSATQAARRDYVTRLRSTVELLQRRKAAASLFPGRCRADELAFYREFDLTLKRVCGFEDKSPPAEKHQLHLCMGVSALATAAKLAGELVRMIRVNELERACSTDDMQLFLHFAADALELFASPASSMP